MQTITMIGLDIAKPVFQVHGFDAAGNVIVRRSASDKVRWWHWADGRDVRSHAESWRVSGLAADHAIKAW